MDDQPLDLSKKSTSSTIDHQLFSSDKYLESEEEKQITSTSRIFFQEEFSKSGEISRRQNEQQTMKAVPSLQKTNANETVASQETITGNSVRNKRNITTGPEINSRAKRCKDVASLLHPGIQDKSRVLANRDCSDRVARDYITPKSSTSADVSSSYDFSAVQGPSTSDNRVLPFICEYCGKGFPFHSTYKTHVRSHTGEKPFVCEVCNKMYATSSGFARHNRLHTGEKLFACKLCDKRFSTPSGLASHTRKHTGELPFRCQKCNKGFSQLSNLKVHMRIHSGEKPYECEICGRRFSQKVSLDIHKVAH